MTDPCPEDQITPYPLTEEEQSLLDYEQAMREICIEANRKCGELDPATRGRFAQQECCRELAIERGYEGYGGPRLLEAFALIQKINAYERKQKALLEQKRWRRILRKIASKNPPRHQLVGTTWLHSRFEIDVWRGLYRFILRNRGCYDPSLSFKDLRAKFPLTDDELDATARVTMWITCPSSHAWEPMIPDRTLAVIKALISPGTS